MASDPCPDPTFVHRSPALMSYFRDQSSISMSDIDIDVFLFILFLLVSVCVIKFVVSERCCLLITKGLPPSFATVFFPSLLIASKQQEILHRLLVQESIPQEIWWLTDWICERIAATFTLKDLGGQGYAVSASSVTMQTRCHQNFPLKGISLVNHYS